MRLHDMPLAEELQRIKEERDELRALLKDPKVSKKDKKEIADCLVFLKAEAARVAREIRKEKE